MDRIVCQNESQPLELFILRIFPRNAFYVLSTLFCYSSSFLGYVFAFGVCVFVCVFVFSQNIFQMHMDKEQSWMPWRRHRQRQQLRELFFLSRVHLRVRALLSTLREDCFMFIPCILTTLFVVSVHFIQSFRSLFYICAFACFCSHESNEDEHIHCHTKLNENETKKKFVSALVRLDNLLILNVVCQSKRMVFCSIFIVFLFERFFNMDRNCNIARAFFFSCSFCSNRPWLIFLL